MLIIQVGTLRSAEIQTDLLPALFPTRSTMETPAVAQENQMNTSRPRSSNAQMKPSTASKTDVFDSDDQLFNDFLEIGALTLSSWFVMLTQKHRPVSRLDWPRDREFIIHA